MLQHLHGRASKSYLQVVDDCVDGEREVLLVAGDEGVPDSPNVVCAEKVAPEQLDAGLHPPGKHDLRQRERVGDQRVAGRYSDVTDSEPV